MLPLTVTVWVAEAAPVVALKLSGPVGVAAIVGVGAVTVPLRVMVWLVAPVLATVSVPFTVPAVAVLARRTYTAVAATVPLAGVRLTLLLKGPVAEVATS